MSMLQMSLEMLENILVPYNFLNFIIMITPHFFIIIVLVTIAHTLSMLMIFLIL